VWHETRDPRPATRDPRSQIRPPIRTLLAAGCEKPREDVLAPGRDLRQDDPTRSARRSVFDDGRTGLLIWLVGQMASAPASFDLPILASRPCIVITMLLPFLGCLGALARREHGRRSYLPPRHVVIQE
jgi:hypothetical protein